MSEQEQLSAETQAQTPVGAAAAGVATDTEPLPEMTATVEPAAEDASYKEPVPSGAMAALLDEMHMAVEYASDEVKHTIRHLVARLRDML